MNLPALVIYDDARGRFGPLTDRSAVFSLRTGAVTNRVRIEAALRQMASTLIVPGRLVDVQRERETEALVNSPLRRPGPIAFRAADARGEWSAAEVGGGSDVLLVSGRWLGFPALTVKLVRELPLGHVLRQQSDGDVIAAHLGVDDAQRWVDARFDDAALPAGAHSVPLPHHWLISRPWHILDRLEETAAHDLPRSAVAESAKVHPTAVLDDSQGAVVVDGHATIGAFCVLEGPVYVGPHTIVQPHTLLRPRTMLGPKCKVAGEISFSIVHGYTNKAHFGYLGHSLVGAWCNLGAGTVVSNLKNTYGPVRMQLDADAAPEDTRRGFQGPVVGDFVRTAIGTRILTGSCIGTATMLATSRFSPKFTRAGAFLTDDGETAHDVDKLVALVRGVVTRRGEMFSDAEGALLREVIRG